MNFESPVWFWVLVVVPMIAVGGVVGGRLGGRWWEKFAARRLEGRLVRVEGPLRRWVSLGFLLGGVGVLVVTLARPQGDAGVKTETTVGRNVMIALDVSRSMNVQDVRPDRLSQAKILIYELLENLKNDRVGLVGFAGTPYLFAPLTIDHAAVKETVEQIDGEWVSVGGSDLAAAIQLATATLKETGQKNNTLVVISDGEEHEGDLDAMVASAESAGVTIFAIGVGTEDGGFVPHPDFPGGLVDREGRRILSTLKSDVMRKLANETGGTYVLAGGGADIPAMVEAAVKGMDSFEMDGGQTRVVVEFFQWVLLPGIFFLMGAIVVGTRWRGVGKVVGKVVGLGLLGCSMMQESGAASAGDARRAFSEKRYDQARDAYRSLAEGKGVERAAQFRLGEGLAAYRAGDFRGARKAYSGAMLTEEPRVSSEGHEGMGNTLFQLGWMGLSGSGYPEGGGIPEMGEFDELVRGQLRAMVEAGVPAKGETNEFIRLDSIMVNWADAARHYRSALEDDPKNEGASVNEELTVRFLKRLEELLQEEKDKAEQEMPQQGAGEPQAEGDGKGEPGEKGEGKGKEGEGQPKEGPGEKDEGEAGGDEQKDEGEAGAGDKEGEPEEDGGKNPNESAEERARRRLSENQDLEKGNLAPGRLEIRDPEKDY